ncbi:MAG: carbon monoxide dehydrogenase [SAR202 cluster bacterium Io17-Chloro-G6]|nr:MAG: carbon monoxide dehydrogenase [SAR202 cluster bacterium Io17-Chloro-G6]
MEPFEFATPSSIDEAVKLLASNGDKASMIAGGTDILVQMRGGRRTPTVVVDVKSIPELNAVSYDASKGLTLGAAVPCYKIYQDKTLAAAYPGLIDTAWLIGGIQIQGRASIGGNICNAAPSGDSIPAVIALGGVCNIAGPNGTRELPAEEFCTAPGRNALQNGEMLVSIFLPAPVPHSGANYQRFIPRNEMDIAVVGVGSSVVLDGSGQNFVSARISLASVAPTPVFAQEAGDSLAGKAVSEEAIQQASELAMAAAKPISDMRGTIRQRTHLVGVFTRRTLNNAIERARGG